MSKSGTMALFAETGKSGAVDHIDPIMSTFSKPNCIVISSDGCSLYITQDENVIREIKFNDSSCYPESQK